MVIAVAALISRVESSDNQYAQRFEKLHLGVSKPSVISRIIAAHRGNISRGTADVYASMSHGFYQIMGFELYGDKIGYSFPIWNFLNNPAEQLVIFNRFLILDGLQMFTVNDLKNDTTKREHFARCYNGPGNVADYCARLLAAISKMEK